MRNIHWRALGVVAGVLGATIDAGAQATPPSNDPPRGAHGTRARFVPTRIGGCVARRSFVQVFEFSLP